MDIRLPKVPHSWRELAKEIAIIVVGVLIALTAEQILDNWQWRIKVDASVRSMRRELFFDDGPQVYMRAAVHPCAQAYLQRIRTAIDSGRPRSEISAMIDGYWVEYLTYDTTAHQAATASDIAVHMPSDELEAFNSVYNAIPDMDEIGKKEAGDLARLRGLRRSGGPLSDYEATETAAAVEALRIDDNDMWVSVRWSLPVMEQLGGTFDPGRIRRFMGNAREHYGDCVRFLPPNWPAGVPMPKE